MMAMETPDPVINNELLQTEPVMNDELAHTESDMNGEVVHSEPVMNDELAHTEPVMNNELVNSEQVMTNELAHTEPAKNDEVAHNEPATNNELVHTEPVMNDELVHTEPVMNNHDHAESFMKDELVHAEPVMNNNHDEHDESFMNDELVHTEPVMNNNQDEHDESFMKDELVHAEPVINNNHDEHDESFMKDELVHAEPIMNNNHDDHAESFMKDELVHVEPVMNNNHEHAESFMNAELVHTEPVMNNMHDHAEQFMNDNNSEQVMNNKHDHAEPFMNNELVHRESVMNNELVHVEPVMNDDLVAMDTQSIDSDMQLDVLEPQPYITETPQNDSETQPTKRRKKKSIVWEHFTIETVGAGCRRACCKQCKQSFAYSTGSKVAGTSHLKRHIAKGTCPVVLRNQEQNQSPFSAPSKMGTYPDTPKRRYRTVPVSLVAFDADRCRHEIAKMIIMHDYPLHMVEHPGFLAFVRNLQPRFDMVSLNTIQGDCVATYLQEKQSIQKVIEKIPGRICLTLDLWSSSRTFGYMFLTGQFIDSDWKMHRKILNVIMEPYPDSDSAFSHSVAACLSDWGMDGKLFSLTINQPLNDAAIDNLRAHLSVKNPLIFNGQLLVGNCLARSLSGIVQDALTSTKDIVKKVRDSVKYVKTSESREEKFLELKQQLQVACSKSLAIDDLSQWNTTYEMLLAALGMKSVFSYMGTLDPDYKEAPTSEDWKQIEVLCSYLKPLFDTANLLTAETTPTTNTFFHEAWKIHLELARAAASEDSFVCTLASSMLDHFNNYWKSCCYILAIAVVMDPRFKMKLVEFSFSKIYGEEAASYVKVVEEGIHELFREYLALASQPHAEGVNGVMVKLEDLQGLGTSSNGLALTDFDAYIMETTSQLSKSELDLYLEDSLLPRVHNFDVLGWWKLNRTKYPTLSKMARDILSIPVCSVPAASVFDTVRKEMDSYRCSLRPETVEALICAKHWLQAQKVESSIQVVVKKESPI